MERTFWDSSLLVSLTLWDTLVLFTPPLPLPQKFDGEFCGLVFPGLQAHQKNSRPKFTPQVVGIRLQFHFLEPKIYSRRCSASGAYSGPLNRLNAILSLLHPLDRYRTPSAVGSAIGRPLSRPISHPNTGGSPQPPCSKPLGGFNRAIVAL